MRALEFEADLSSLCLNLVVCRAVSGLPKLTINLENLGRTLLGESGDYQSKHRKREPEMRDMLLLSIGPHLTGKLKE
jgi:hypothetical protein